MIYITSVWIKEKAGRSAKRHTEPKHWNLCLIQLLTLYVFKQPSGYDIQMTCVIVDRSMRKIRNGSLIPLNQV